jgi:glycosyltransferase involved in cell wall biosynthesis
MKILFVHNNFPAQFRNLVVTLSAMEDVRMAVIGCETARAMRGIDLHRYQTPHANPSVHSFARRFDHECRRAEQVLYAATALAGSGFTPDVILVHPGWGENLPLRAVFPNARIIVYCEFFYRSVGQDAGFDPEFAAMGLDGHVALQARNAASLIALAEGDSGLSPTLWQKSAFPKEFQAKISVIHDGIDTDTLKPDAQAMLTLASGATLTAYDEVVTYSARNLEPLRGFHIFMRALPRVLAERPGAQVLIVGGDGVSYGAVPQRDPSWKAALLRELGDVLDLKRVHFLGHLAYAEYMKVLQISSVHVYFTYPFVLSWSLLEAMSVGCVVIGSDTAPLREVIDGSNGLLVPFFSPQALSEAIMSVLADPERHAPMRKEARRTVRKHYDAKRVCVPKLIEFVRGDRAPHSDTANLPS